MMNFSSRIRGFSNLHLSNLAREYLVWLKSLVRRDRQSSMGIDMIRVIRRDPRSMIVLVFPSGSLQTSMS
uniref:Uncharacterized protein n=1 Tax=Cucumis melo TaxID=3656 RepID=A0A9I9EG49_CUCME